MSQARSQKRKVEKNQANKLERTIVMEQAKDFAENIARNQIKDYKCTKELNISLCYQGCTKLGKNEFKQGTKCQ